jgi:hypothetical protein
MGCGVPSGVPPGNIFIVETIFMNLEAGPTGVKKADPPEKGQRRNR